MLFSTSDGTSIGSGGRARSLAAVLRPRGVRGHRFAADLGRDPGGIGYGAPAMTKHEPRAGRFQRK